MATKTALDEQALYLGDNGRATCGKLRCAGVSAYYNGRALSGQPLRSVEPLEAIRHGIRCESCGLQPAIARSRALNTAPSNQDIV